ncbi:MAG: DapH/DapD/GlmU-related protein [Vampirovibrionales bacterium]
MMMMTHIVPSLATSSSSEAIHPSSVVDASVQLGEGVRIAPFCVIEAGVRIGANTVIGPYTHLASGVMIGEECNIHSSYIEAGVQIGHRCSVGPYAHLRTGSLLHDEVRIGNFVETKNATLFAGAKAPHLAYVGDATLGEGVNFAAGAITANYNPQTKVKSHTQIEANASIGANCVLVAPVTIGERGFVAAGSTITKDVPAQALAVARGKQVMKPDWNTP